MKIISIDVGIKNLSYCLFDTDIVNINKRSGILKWDNIDLSTSEPSQCAINLCNKPAKYKKNNCQFCVSHAKKQTYSKIPKQLLPKNLKKLSLLDLNKLLDKYLPNSQSNMKKTEIWLTLAEYVNEKCFEDIISNDATKLSIVTIGRNIVEKLDLILKDEIEHIQLCIIENQIGPLAVKMKTIQGMLSQYFIMRNTNIQIDFVNASNKLKEFVKEKTDYKERKKLGVLHCFNLIEESWKPFFSSHAKKDDLSDCYLQGLWYIKNNINTINN